MMEAVHELLDKSEQSINAANLLLGDGYDDFAASRAYYAMFYARALNNCQFCHFDRREKSLTAHNLLDFSSLTLLAMTKFKALAPA